jgi:hypothetical protein
MGEFIAWVKLNIKEIGVDEFEEGKTKIFVRSPETIFVLEDRLFQKLDPEGYKTKVHQFKESERMAQAKAGKHSLKPKCLIQ